jgi:pectin methylesterase-like acyl-CoA thioesterase
MRWWAWLTFFCAVILTAFFMRSPAAAQGFCFPNMQTAVAEAQKHGEVLRFSVVMKIGALLHIFAGEKTMTIFVEQPNGMLCTSDALVGDIVNQINETCA